ncbi:hypothetical protein Bbelb_230560 [Branchiostoma belcheri]|nr:hypothetical protein Bbelb_230560 [Branchiostoma belcheri]
MSDDRERNRPSMVTMVPYDRIVPHLAARPGVPQPESSPDLRQQLFSPRFVRKPRGTGLPFIDCSGIKQGQQNFSPQTINQHTGAAGRTQKVLHWVLIVDMLSAVLVSAGEINRDQRFRILIGAIRRHVREGRTRLVESLLEELCASFPVQCQREGSGRWGAGAASRSLVEARTFFFFILPEIIRGRPSPDLAERPHCLKAASRSLVEASRPERDDDVRGRSPSSSVPLIVCDALRQPALCAALSRGGEVVLDMTSGQNRAGRAAGPGTPGMPHREEGTEASCGAGTKERPPLAWKQPFLNCLVTFAWKQPFGPVRTTFRGETDDPSPCQAPIMIHNDGAGGVKDDTKGSQQDDICCRTDHCSR